MNVALRPFTDIHCHLLPGIDDGPDDWDETLRLAEALVANEIRTVIATPHQLGLYEATTPAQIRALTSEAQDRVDRARIPLRIMPGADIRIREDLAELTRRGQVLSLADKKAHVLLELPSNQVLPLENLIYQLGCAGLSVILSHPERNQALMHQPERLRAWIRQGCLMQITAASITGDFGSEPEKWSRRLLRQRLVHLVATDAHDSRARPPRMSEAHGMICRWFGRAEAKKLFVSNPEKIASGQEVHAPLPMTCSRNPISHWCTRVFGG